MSAAGGGAAGDGGAAGAASGGAAGGAALSPWWAVATFVVTTFTAGGLLRLVDDEPDASMVSIVALAPAIGAGLTWLIGRRWLATMLPIAVSRRQAIAHSILGVGAAMLLGVLALVGVLLWPDAAAHGVLGEGVGGGQGTGVDALPFAALALLLLPCVLAQELGWRGILQPLMEPRLGRLLACVVTGVVWAAWRLEVMEPATLIGTIVLSVALSVLVGYLGTGTWWQRVLTATVVQWLVSLALLMLVGVDPVGAGFLVAAAAAVVTAGVFLLLFRSAQRRRAARRDAAAA